MRAVIAIVTFLIAGSAGAQTIYLPPPDRMLSPASPQPEPEDGIAFAIEGLTGTFVASDHPMSVAPGATAITAEARLDGTGPYLGTGLRMFYHGRFVRAGGMAGLFAVDRGLTRPKPDSGTNFVGRGAMGAHFEVFAGGQIPWDHVVPYLDVVGMLDIVHSRYDVFQDSPRPIDDTAFNAYLLSAGPRVGMLLPIHRHIYLDLGAFGGVLGQNRFMFTAGIGYSSFLRKPTLQSEIYAL